MTLQKVLALVLFTSSILLPAVAQEITVAAAADLQFALHDITARFERESGKTVKVVYGSSGNFFQQIQNGAPFDLFFSANLEYARKLEASAVAEPGTLYQYATGRIVLWVPTASKLDLKNNLQSLLDPSIHNIAIANPAHAPYGQAAVSAMKNENVYDRVSHKLVLGENISQAASFVLSGSADAGIIALSLALSPNMRDKGRYIEIPPKDYPPIEQACVILKRSQKKDLALAFLEFFKSAAVAETLRSYGFGVKQGSEVKK
jgi:molybdate transport system substrate-binding protein